MLVLIQCFFYSANRPSLLILLFPLPLPVSPHPLLVHSSSSTRTFQSVSQSWGGRLGGLSLRGLPQAPPRGIACGPVPFCPSVVRICTNEPQAPAWGPGAPSSGMSSSSPAQLPPGNKLMSCPSDKNKRNRGKGPVQAGPVVSSETLHQPAHQLLRAGLIRGALQSPW